MTDTREVVCRAIRLEAEGIFSFELAARAGALPAFTAGSHIDVRLPNGLVRSYSLVNAPPETHAGSSRWVIAVSRDRASRGGSVHLHDRIRPGDVLTVTDPRCAFPLEESASHSVLVAGGIGITPIWSMIQRLSELGRSWELHYGARSAREAAFVEPIVERARTSGAQVELSFADETGGRWLDLDSIVRRAPRGSHFYGCGPTGMLELFRQATSALPAGQARTESFVPAPAATTGGDFVVELARSKRTLVVAEGTTILETLLQNGISHAYSCTQGICGTCVTTVLEGEPDHRDWVLDDAQKAAGRTMMICCSGSKTGRLVLDL